MLSASGSTCCQDQDKMGYISRKKHPITDDDQDNTTLLSGNKKVKKNIPNIEADSSSSDKSCFVAHVTASNLHEDSLCLPQDFTSLNGFKRKCRKIVLTDERERSWALDLRFNRSSDTFYVTRGWRNFCEENDKNAGSLFNFKLMRNGETPLLSVCATESISDGTKGKENISQACRDSTSPNQNRFVTLTLTNDSLKSSRLYLPLPFLKENGMDKPGMVTLLGKDGTRRLANLLRESSGRMSLGKGLKDFAKANGLNMGESFTMELIWENATPVLSLLNTKFRSQNRFVTLTLTNDSFKNSGLGLPLPFMRENGMNEPGTIVLLGKDGTKWMANLLRESQGRMSLGKGWKDFARANGLEIGESFTLESIWEDATPMLSLSTDPSTGNETKKDENNIEGMTNASSLVQN